MAEFSVGLSVIAPSRGVYYKAVVLVCINMDL